MNQSSMARGAGAEMAGGFTRPNLPELQRWTRGVAARKCARVVLNVFADGREMLVRDWDLLGAEPEQVAEEIDDRATSEGRTMRGPALFALYAYGSGGVHVDRKQFRIESDSFPRTGETEPADASGIIGMLMRHSEAATKIALGHTTHIISQYQNMLARTQDRVAELEDALQGYVQLERKLAVDESTYRIAEQELVLKGKRMEMLKEKSDLVFPVLMEWLAGKAVRSHVITDEQLKQLLGSLTPQQMGALASVLTAEQAGVLFHLYNSYAQRVSDQEVAKAAREAAQAQTQATPGAPQGAAPPKGQGS